MRIRNTIGVDLMHVKLFMKYQIFVVASIPEGTYDPFKITLIT